MPCHCPLVGCEFHNCHKWSPTDTKSNPPPPSRSTCLSKGRLFVFHNRWVIYEHIGNDFGQWLLPDLFISKNWEYSSYSRGRWLEEFRFVWFLDWLGVGVEDSLITYCYEIAASANRHFEKYTQKFINVLCQMFLELSV